jgi:hypothetical protein
MDVIYRTHGSRDAVYGIHPGAAADGVEFVDVQFASVVIHVSLLLCLGRDHPPQAVVAGEYAASFIDDVRGVTLQIRPLKDRNRAGD